MKTIKMKIKSILKSKISYFIFNRTRVKADIYIFQMYAYFGRYKKIAEIQDLHRNRDDFWFFKYNKFFFLNVKNFIF